MSDDDFSCFMCKDIGVSGITDVYVKENPDGTFTARMGVALLGTVNSDHSYGANPFSDSFIDNYAEGTGSTKEEAIDKMIEDKKSICDSLWYI